MHGLTVQITRFLGWEPNLASSSSRSQTLKVANTSLSTKIPIIRTEPLDENCEYPRPGFVACEILSRSKDEQGQELVLVSTKQPWGVESNEGLTEFVVPASQLYDSVAHS